MNRPIALALMLTAFAAAGCNRPISDPDELRAIRSEAMTLMETHPAQSSPGYTAVAKEDWPATIARLQPEMVTVYTWGVDIVTKPYFDGGWGYEVPLERGNLPMPASCYSEPGPGVFWHGPC